MDPDAEAPANGHSIEELKSGKKKKEKKTADSSEDDELASAEKKEKKKKMKERKASDEEGSDSGSDGRENIKELADGSSFKKAKLMEKEEDENPNALSKFRLSEAVKEKLKSKGIEALFPIQAMTFKMILDGSDLVGRALTGQVHVDFEFYGGAVGLSACSIYGGAPIREQEFALKQGVDIIVGTLRQIKDLIERNTLDLKALKFRVLDEADEMLNMGFVDDVEFILSKVEDANKVQALLFSATLPDWVKKASASVRHMFFPVLVQRVLNLFLT